MPSRVSRIERHTSALSRPIAQMMPAPVTAMRMFGSGFRMGRRGETKPGPGDFYSVDAADGAEPMERTE